MVEICCPICEQNCDIQEGLMGLGYSSEETCEVAVCLNKKCPNYDKVVFDVNEYLFDREKDNYEEYILEKSRGVI